MALYGILIGLSGALCWGMADILATIVLRRVGILTTLFFSHLWALPLLFVFLALVWGPLALTQQALLQSLPLGLVIGLLTAAGYFAFYRGLELGPVAIVSPLISVDGAVTALLALLILHESFGIWQGWALVILFLGIILASLDSTSPLAFFKTLGTSSIAKGGTRWALIAVILFSFSLFGIGLATTSVGWFLPIFWMRIFSTLTIACVQLWQYIRVRSHTFLMKHAKDTRSSSWPPGIGLAALVGMLDSGGLLLYSFDTHVIATGIAAGIVSCFVLLPLLFGIIVLHERLAKHQALGISLVLIGLIVLGYNSV